MTLPKITLKLDDVEYSHSCHEELLIDRTNLDEEIATQAERYHKYASLWRIAEDKAARKKAAFDILKSQIDYEKRTFAGNNPNIKYTEKMYDNEVKLDSRYKAAQDEVLEADHLTRQLEELSKSFAQRKGMLETLGKRQEIVQPMRILEQSERDVREIMERSRSERTQNLPFPQIQETPPPAFPSMQTLEPIKQQDTLDSVIEATSALKVPSETRRRRRTPQETQTT